MKALDLANKVSMHLTRVENDSYESKDKLLDAVNNLRLMAHDIIDDPLDEEYNKIADELASKEAEIEKLKTDLKNKDSQVTYWMNENTKTNATIESINRILDNLHNAPKRDDSANFPEGTDSWKITNYSVIERFAMWLSNK